MEKLTFKTFEVDTSEIKAEKFNHEMNISSVEIADGAIVDIGVVDAREFDSDGTPIGATEIYPLSNGSWLVDSHSSASVEVSRAIVSAEASKSRIIYMGYPNITMAETLGEISNRVDGRELTKEEAGQPTENTPFMRQLSNAFGRYRRPAKQMLEGLHKVVDFENGEKIKVSGFAQSTAEAAAIVEAITKNPEANKNLNITHVKMIESPNDQSRAIDIPVVKNIMDITRIIKSAETESHLGKHHFESNNIIDDLNGPVDLKAEEKLRNLRSKYGNAVILSGAPLMRPSTPLILNAIKYDVENNTSGIASAKFDLLRFEGSGLSDSKSMEKTAKQILDASPLTRVALHRICSAPGQQELQMEAFQSLPIVELLYSKEGPLA